MDMEPIINELGNVKSTYYGAKPGDFNVLNAPDEIYNAMGPRTFFDEVNIPFLNAAIQRGDNILMATRPGFNVVNRDGEKVLTRLNVTTGKYELTGFGREYAMLRARGFIFRDGKMVRK